MAAGEGPAKIEDVAGVRSRISWQAVLAGAITAIATNLVLTLFFAAIGISLTESGVREKAVSVGALIAILLSVIASLFVGGWVTTQLTAGETEREAILYGIMTWAAVVLMSAMLVGMGLKAGYFALMSGAMATPEVRNAQELEQAARNAGWSQTSIDAAKASVDPNRPVDPFTRDKMNEAAVGAAWATLVAVLLSMASAIGGAMVGRGPAFRFFPATRVQTVEARREIIIP